MLWTAENNRKGHLLNIINIVIIMANGRAARANKNRFLSRLLLHKKNIFFEHIIKVKIFNIFF